MNTNDTQTWFAVQYESEPGWDEWADTYHGDHFTTVEAARHFAAQWELPSRTRIVERTERVIQ